MATYYEQNRDRLLTKQNEYYKTNRDAINEKRKNNNKIICECGSSFSKDKAKRHYETKKHIDFVNASVTHENN